MSENVSKATLLAGGGVNTDAIQVQSLDAAMTLSITAPAVDSVVFGTPRIVWDPTFGYHADGASMDGVLGSVEVHSTGTGPSVLVDDSASTTGRSVSINANSITGYSTGRIALLGFTPGKAQILGGSGDDVYSILDRLPGLTINAGAGNDTFKLSNGKGVAGKIDGGGGTNTLDYSLYSTGVTVNLTTGAATGVGGGIANILNVTGSPASDTITGNAGSNVIIGDGGTDKLSGGGGGTDRFILASTQGSAEGQVTRRGHDWDTLPERQHRKHMDDQWNQRRQPEWDYIHGHCQSHGWHLKRRIQIYGRRRGGQNRRRRRHRHARLLRQRRGAGSHR